MNKIQEIGVDGNLIIEEKHERDYMTNYTHHEETRLTNIKKTKPDKSKIRSNDSGIHPVTIRTAKTPRKR